MILDIEASTTENTVTAEPIFKIKILSVFFDHILSQSNPSIRLWQNEQVGPLSQAIRAAKI